MNNQSSKITARNHTTTGIPRASKFLFEAMSKFLFALLMMNCFGVRLLVLVFDRIFVEPIRDIVLRRCYCLFCVFFFLGWSVQTTSLCIPGKLVSHSMVFTQLRKSTL